MELIFSLLTALGFWALVHYWTSKKDYRQYMASKKPRAFRLPPEVDLKLDETEEAISK